MDIKSIDESLRKILGMISRSELNSAADEIGFLTDYNQLPRVTRAIQRSDKGCEGMAPIYPISREYAQRADRVIRHLDSALSSLHAAPAASEREIATAINIWSPAALSSENG